jgi:hypothetical protein
MHMTGAVRVFVQFLQQLTHGAIMGDRIRHWSHGLELEPAVLVGAQDAPTIRVSSTVRILRIITARLVGFLDVESGAGDRAARGIAQRAPHQTRLSLAGGAD